MVSEETEKHLPLLALMKKKGRIKTGSSGGQFRWVVRIKDHALQGFPDNTPVNFNKIDTKENAYLPWRGYYASDTITLREKLEQGGPEAMIKIFANREETIRRGITRGLASEFFKDGNLAANVAAETFHGIESMMSIGAQTDADVVATTHNDTYANLSTAVGGLDATQDRCWTPVIINTDRTPTGGSQQTWANYADEYIRAGRLRATYGSGPDDSPDVCLLNRDAFEALLNLLDDKERISIARGSNSELVSLGFRNHVELDGLPIMWGAEVPANDASPYLGGGTTSTVRGYLFTTGRMELKVLGKPGDKSLFTSKVTFNDTYRADNIFLSLLGNLKFDSPRHFGKLADISAVA